MGLLNLAGELAGAVAAVEGAEKLDPGAGLLVKGVAAIAGFKGADALESLVEKKGETPSADAEDGQQTADNAGAGQV